MDRDLNPGEIMASKLTLSMNDAKEVVTAGPETPLLFVLRLT